MRQLTRLTLVVVAFCGYSLAQSTNLYLRSTNSSYQLSSEYVVKQVNGGSAGTQNPVATATENSITGPISGQYFPSSTPGHIWTDTAGGLKIVWFSDPLASAVTVSGTVTPHVWCVESSPSSNIGFRYEIFRWSKETGGIASSLGASATASPECNKFTPQLITTPTLSVTSTSFAAGDRIVIVIYNSDPSNGQIQVSGRTATINYNGSAANSADTYFTFPLTLTFAVDDPTAAGAAGPDYGTSN
jgi:hypothetical protein